MMRLLLKAIFQRLNDKLVINSSLVYEVYCIYVFMYAYLYIIYVNYAL